MGAIELEDVDVSAGINGKDSVSSVDISETSDKSIDKTVDKVDKSIDRSKGKSEVNLDKSDKVSDKSSDKGSDKSSNNSQGKSVEEKVIEEFLKVGEKAYTKEQAIAAIEKIGRYQGDRDQTEAALEKIARQLTAAGYMIDNSLNIVPAQQKPSRQTREELSLLAAAGDNDALNKLLELHGEEVASKVFSGIQMQESTKEILAKTRKDYPDFYSEDGSPNLSSPLSKEAAKIIEAYPHLGTIQSLPLVAQLAESALIKGNFKNVEQSIKDKAHQRVAQGGSQGLGTPAGSISDTDSGEFTPEQANFAKKLGVNSERLGKIIARASKSRGGYEI